MPLLRGGKPPLRRRFSGDAGDSFWRRHGLPTVEAAGRPPRFIATAARYGLGVGDPSAIKEVLA